MASSRRGSGGRSVRAPRRRRPRRQFFIQSALDRAANLVLERAYDVDQDQYEILIPTAEVARRQAPPRRDDTAAGDDQLFPRRTAGPGDTGTPLGTCSIAPAYHRRSRITAPSSRMTPTRPGCVSSTEGRVRFGTFTRLIAAVESGVLTKIQHAQLRTYSIQRCMLITTAWSCTVGRATNDRNGRVRWLFAPRPQDLLSAPKSQNLPNEIRRELTLNRPCPRRGIGTGYERRSIEERIYFQANR